MCLFIFINYIYIYIYRAGPVARGDLRRHSKRGPIVYNFFFTCNINIKPKTLVFIMLKPKIILQQLIHKEGF